MGEMSRCRMPHDHFDHVHDVLFNVWVRSFLGNLPLTLRRRRHGLSDTNTHGLIPVPQERRKRLIYERSIYIQVA
jgi:hypothetical protein